MQHKSGKKPFLILLNGVCASISSNLRVPIDEDIKAIAKLTAVSILTGNPDKAYEASTLCDYVIGRYECDRVQLLQHVHSVIELEVKKHNSDFNSFDLQSCYKPNSVQASLPDEPCWVRVSP